MLQDQSLPRLRRDLTSLQRSPPKLTRIKTLGQGAFGKVREVKESTGKVFAEKLINFDASMVTPVLRELNVLRKLSQFNPYLLQSKYVHFHGDADGNPIEEDGVFTATILTEVLSGSLIKMMDEDLTSDQFSRYFFQVFCGLNALHEAGLIHADIKPDNIFYDPVHDKVKIGDFGLVSWKNEALRGTGSPGYWAPEVARGEPVTQKSDIYSLMFTLLELLLGVYIDSSMDSDFDAKLAKFLKANESVSDTLFLDNLLSTFELKVYSNRRELLGETKLLPLIRKGLTVDPTKRPTAAQVLEALGSTENCSVDVLDALKVLKQDADIDKIISQLLVNVDEKYMDEFSAVLDVLFHRRPSLSDKAVKKVLKDAAKFFEVDISTFIV